MSGESDELSVTGMVFAGQPINGFIYKVEGKLSTGVDDTKYFQISSDKTEVATVKEFSKEALEEGMNTSENEIVWTTASSYLSPITSLLNDAERPKKYHYIDDGSFFEERPPSSNESADENSVGNSAFEQDEDAEQSAVDADESLGDSHSDPFSTGADDVGPDASDDLPLDIPSSTDEIDLTTEGSAPTTKASRKKKAVSPVSRRPPARMSNADVVVKYISDHIRRLHWEQLDDVKFGLWSEAYENNPHVNILDYDISENKLSIPGDPHITRNSIKDAPYGTPEFNATMDLVSTTMEIMNANKAHAPIPKTMEKYFRSIPSRYSSATFWNGDISFTTLRVEKSSGENPSLIWNVDIMGKLHPIMPAWFDVAFFGPANDQATYPKLGTKAHRKAAKASKNPAHKSVTHVPVQSEDSFRDNVAGVVAESLKYKPGKPTAPKPAYPGFINANNSKKLEMQPGFVWEGDPIPVIRNTPYTISYASGKNGSLDALVFINGMCVAKFNAANVIRIMGAPLVYDKSQNIALENGEATYDHNTNRLARLVIY